MKNESGFTIIELILVIAIIGLLSSVVVVATQGPREKGRDSRRVSDIKQIENALALYRADNSGFPSSVKANVTGSDTMSVALSNGNYLIDPALDPTYPTTAYAYESTGSTYTLYFTLETNSIPTFSVGENSVTR